MLTLRDIRKSYRTARVSNGTTNNAARDQVMIYFTSLKKGHSVRITSPEEIIAQMEKQMQMFTLLLGANETNNPTAHGTGNSSLPDNPYSCRGV